SQATGPDNLGGRFREPPLPSLIPSEVGAIGLNRANAMATDPRVMKQILLRVATVFAEVRFRELPQPLRAHFLSTRKIILPQHALDPDINRECAQPFIRK